VVLHTIQLYNLCRLVLKIASRMRLVSFFAQRRLLITGLFYVVSFRYTPEKELKRQGRKATGHDLGKVKAHSRTLSGYSDFQLQSRHM
jgi:hypothetical protein